MHFNSSSAREKDVHLKKPTYVNAFMFDQIEHIFIYNIGFLFLETRRGATVYNLGMICSVVFQLDNHTRHVLIANVSVEPVGHHAHIKQL